MLAGIEAATARRRLDRLGGGPDSAARPRPEERPGHDALPQIEHIVILMMENHSYDSYFGMLRDRGRGLDLDEAGLPTAVNKTKNGEPVRPTRSNGTRQSEHVPSQSWHATHIQWNEGACDGFVASIEQTEPDLDARAGMRYWNEEDLPFYYALARTFPVADHWFSSCLGPTFPNRRFLISGTANGLIDDVPFGMIDTPANGTIFDQLELHGIRWANYHHMPPLRIGWRLLAHARGLKVFRVLGAVLGSAVPGVRRTLMSKLQTTADLYPLGLPRAFRHLEPMERFYAAAKAGKLPAVSIVDPDFNSGSEENPQDIARGEAFASRIIHAVMNGKGWPKTLLIWLYDEHGGFYDHVAPPAAPAPDDVPGRNSMDRFRVTRLLRNTTIGKKILMADAGPSTYTQLGFRVPAVIVSPYARKDYVADQVYDHTSVLALIEHKWNLPPLTARDAAARNPIEALDLDSPPAFLTPPKLPVPPTQPSKRRRFALW